MTSQRKERWAAAALVSALLVGTLVLLMFTYLANAQTPRSATITFTRPTQYSDGTALGSGVTLSYNVYQGAKGSSSKPKVGTITATATTITSGLQPGETCWEITTIANGVESAKSNEACKAFPFPAPETVTITVT